MPRMKEVPSNPQPSVKSLNVAIGKSEQIKKVVEECATELSVVNTVLKGQIDQPAARPEVAGAIEKSEAVEAKVQDSADALTKVNEALLDEVRERQLLEHQLEALQEREHAARQAALHDPLTSLPNRVLFNDRLEHALAQARRHGWTIAIMFIDLDDFKTINDTHGHEVGDEVLKAMAGRLQKLTREDDTVSRHGGDEFLYLLSDVRGNANAEAIAKKIMGSLSQPCELGGKVVQGLNVKASIGIALYPADALTADDLVRCADRAMHCAKRFRLFGGPERRAHVIVFRLSPRSNLRVACRLPTAIAPKTMRYESLLFPGLGWSPAVAVLLVLGVVIDWFIGARWTQRYVRYETRISR